MRRSIDYTKSPCEDFARVMIEFKTADGCTVIDEASTSWRFVRAGLRVSAKHHHLIRGMARP